ncbi:MAG: DUF2142 domain-containing protein [Actinobacteria bacterium]|nr:DUF2142 domain-containing protein [Actinomycetota bacterium]
MPERPIPSERRRWWALFALWFAVGAAWALATPPVTGPDEVEQARRAAAVVRGELIGARQPGVPPLVVDVDVPDTYGEASVDHWRCFLGPLVDGSPQVAMPLPPSTCPEISSSRARVTVQTVQYRGQPFFYAWVGLGTFWPGVTGMYLMRLLSIVPVAALLASAARSLREGGRDRLAALGLVVAVTPMVLYLAASTNPSGLETAAAIAAWAAGVVLADPAVPTSRRSLARFGLALVVLAAARGLGPLFAAAVLGGVAVVAGWRRTAELGRRRDVWAWGGVLAVAVALSGAWLAHLQAHYALPDRPGTGWTTAFGYLPWYLRQAVGVFGTNDSALHPLVAGVWVVVAAAVLAVGLVRIAGRARLVALAALVGGLAIQVTAEGLSVPPIGFFWQGRYALPLLVGAVLVAAAAPRRAVPSTATASAPDEIEPVRHDAGATTPADLRHLATPAVALAAGALGAVHVVAFLTVLRRYTSRGPGSLGLADALFDPRWHPPVPPVLLLVAFVAATAGALVAVLGGVPRRPVGSGAVDATPAEPVSTTA